MHRVIIIIIALVYLHALVSYCMFKLLFSYSATQL